MNTRKTRLVIEEAIYDCDFDIVGSIPDQEVYLVTPTRITQILNSRFLTGEDIARYKIVDIRAYVFSNTDKILNYKPTARYEDLFNAPTENLGINILERGLHITEKTANIEYFINTELTDAEYMALQYILALTRGCGNVSIVKVIEENPEAPTRSIFDSMIRKLQKNNLALVEAQGRRGLFFKFWCDIKALVRKGIS